MQNPLAAGVVSHDNSATALLGAAGVFTGAFEECIGFANLSVLVFADQPSATDGLKIEWSPDGVNVDDSDTYTIPALKGKVYSFGVEARYYRVVYTNGATPQGAFRLQTVLHNTAPKPSSHRIGEAISTENDGELMLAFPYQAPTFYAVFDRIVPDANKYMATLWNGAAGRRLVVQRVLRIPTQIASAAGKELDQELRRITARTVGTAVTPTSGDTADTLTAGIAADHASTAVTDSDLLMRFVSSNDNVAYNSAVFADLAALPSNWLIYDRKPGTRGIVLRQNQGLTIKNITSDTSGTCSYVYEFTDEPA